MKLFKIELREEPPHIKTQIFYLLASLALVFLIIAVLIASTGADIPVGFREFFIGPFKNIQNVAEILVATTPLLFIALGLSISFKSGFWNIGADGQLYAGATLCTGMVLASKGYGIPSVIFIPLLMTIGFLGGALLAMFSAVLKTKFQINEIIVTILLNYIMIYLVSYLLFGPFMDPITAMPQSEFFPLSARFPNLIQGTRLHMGFFFAVVAVPLIYLIFNKTVFGYQVKTIGNSLNAARFAGVNLNRTFILVAVCTGGLAGLAGMGEVSGLFYRLRGDISAGYGYTAILVALLGKNRPGWVALTAILFGFLSVGGIQMQIVTGVPFALASVVSSLIFLGVLAAAALTRYRISWRGK